MYDGMERPGRSLKAANRTPDATNRLSRTLTFPWRMAPITVPYSDNAAPTAAFDTHMGTSWMWIWMELSDSSTARGKIWLPFKLKPWLQMLAAKLCSEKVTRHCPLELTCIDRRAAAEMP